MVQAMSDCIDGGGVQLKPLDLTNVALTVLDNSKVVVPSHPDRDCVLQSVETTDAVVGLGYVKTDAAIPPNRLRLTTQPVIEAQVVTLPFQTTHA